MIKLSRAVITVLLLSPVLVIATACNCIEAVAHQLKIDAKRIFEMIWED